MKTHRQTGNNGGVSTATASQTAPAHPVVNRPNVTTVGFIVFLASDLMFFAALDRKSTRLNSSHVAISYAVFCMKKKNILGERKASHSDTSRRSVQFRD